MSNAPLATFPLLLSLAMFTAIAAPVALLVKAAEVTIGIDAGLGLFAGCGLAFLALSKRLSRAVIAMLSTAQRVGVSVYATMFVLAASFAATLLDYVLKGKGTGLALNPDGSIDWSSREVRMLVLIDAVLLIVGSAITYLILRRIGRRQGDLHSRRP